MTSGFHVETPYQGRLFNVQVLTRVDEHGRQIKREVVRHPGAVLIVPAVSDSELLMIRNERIAARQKLWEFPAGKLEPGEAPEDAAARELEEETGRRAGRISKVGEFYTSPGFTDELMHAFVAEDLTFIGQRLEEGEDIEVVQLSTARILEMIENGEVRDGKSIAGFLLWLRFHERGARSHARTLNMAKGSSA